jgi:hypothetical protein
MNETWITGPICVVDGAGASRQHPATRKLCRTNSTVRRCLGVAGPQLPKGSESSAQADRLRRRHHAPCERVVRGPRASACVFASKFPAIPSQQGIFSSADRRRGRDLAAHHFTPRTGGYRAKKQAKEQADYQAGNRRTLRLLYMTKTAQFLAFLATARRAKNLLRH